MQFSEKLAFTQNLLVEIARDFSPVSFANSFGAEDMVLTDLICKAKLNIEIFSLDTGRLPPETYKIMGESADHYGVKFRVYYPETQVIEQYVNVNGINAFYNSVDQRKECCNIRKTQPLRRALAGKKAWITGLRREQSPTRTDLSHREFDKGNGLEKFNPLIEWTEKEVWAYIKDNKVPYNELHDRFYPSIGCSPCTRAISPGEDVRAGRWWWENPETKECGLHVSK